jgi:hypothetical protein
MLRPFAVLSGWTGQFDELGHFEAHFVLDDFKQGDVGGAQIADVGQEGQARASTAGI